MGQPRSLTVIVAPLAQDDLDSIHAYTAYRHGIGQADDYDDFLSARVAALAVERSDARQIEGHPRLWRVLCQWRPRRDGHILVFEIEEPVGTLSVLRVYHTKMNLPARLEEDFGPAERPGP